MLTQDLFLSSSSHLWKEAVAGSTTGRRRAGMGVERNRIEKEPQGTYDMHFPNSILCKIPKGILFVGSVAKEVWGRPRELPLRRFPFWTFSQPEICYHGCESPDEASVPNVFHLNKPLLSFWCYFMKHALGNTGFNNDTFCHNRW